MIFLLVPSNTNSFSLFNKGVKIVKIYTKLWSKMVKFDIVPKNRKRPIGSDYRIRS